MHGWTDFPCLAGILQVPTYVLPPFPNIFLSRNFNMWLHTKQNEWIYTLKYVYIHLCCVHLKCLERQIFSMEGVQHFSSTIAHLSLLLTHPTCGAGECAYGRFSIAVPHVCANAIWRAFHSESGVPDRLTDRLGCDANTTWVLYTPYMCTIIFLRLCSMAQSMDTKLVYCTI